MTIWLADAGAVPRILTPQRLVVALEQVHREHHRGLIVQPAPTTIVLPGQHLGSGPQAHHVLMSAADADHTLIKALLDAPGRRERGQPGQRSIISVYSTGTGDLIGLLDGAVVTRLRTAAATAMAARLCARPDSTRLAIIGAGALALPHVTAMRSVLPIDHVTVWSRRDAAAAELAQDITATGCHASIAADPQSAVRHSDVVVTLTPATTPHFRAEDLPAGVHLAAVGSPPRPGYREIGPDVFDAADLVTVDDADIAAAESQQVIDAIAAGFDPAELIPIGAIAAGRPGRTSPSQRTVHSSIGVAAQDLAAVRLLLPRGPA